MEKRIIAVDLDHTLCDTDVSLPATEERYRIAPPMKYNIRHVNELYEAGHTIVIYTARGMISCDGDVQRIIRKYSKVTAEWLEEHGVKYHWIQWGKLYYDVILDDKAVNVSDIDRINTRTGTFS